MAHTGWMSAGPNGVRFVPPAPCVQPRFPGLFRQGLPQRPRKRIVLLHAATGPQGLLVWAETVFAEPGFPFGVDRPVRFVNAHDLPSKLREPRFGFRIYFARPREATIWLPIRDGRPVVPRSRPERTFSLAKGGRGRPGVAARGSAGGLPGRRLPPDSGREYGVAARAAHLVLAGPRDLHGSGPGLLGRGPALREFSRRPAEVCPGPGADAGRPVRGR